MFGKVLVPVVLLLSASPSALASRESAEACFIAAEGLNDMPSVREPLQELLEAYNATCKDRGLCTIEADDSFIDAYVDRNPADFTNLATTMPVNVKGSMDFGGSFQDHETLTVFSHECSKAGGKVECVDSLLILNGEISDMLEGSDGDGSGIKVDIEFIGKGFPYCMPKECEGEDLTEVLEDATRDAIMKIPDVKSNLNPTTAALLNEVTFAQMCALSGLPTCQLTVTQSDCSFESGSGVKVGHTLSFLAILSSALIALW